MSKQKYYYAVEGDYGQGDGYEEVTAEVSFLKARDRLREYRENEPGIPFRMKRKKDEDG